MKTFEEIKKLYNEMTDELKDIDTKDKVSGIYMIYIEGIDSNDYIPLYVGQSVNIYNRKSNHKTKIKKVFQMETEVYNKFIPLMSGKYLYCKLVSTLKNNNKTMDSIKFKILEYCSKELLDIKEQYWINYFESTIYGFNQFQEIIDSNKIMASIMYNNGTNKNWNDIVFQGMKTLEDFEDKLKEFNNDLKKYKYYQVNYTLLLGNFNSLYETMNKVSEEHWLDIDEDNMSKLNKVLVELEFMIKVYFKKFIDRENILYKEDLYERFSIK